MAPEMQCEVPKADEFEDLLESMEFDEGLLRELLEEVNGENMDQTSMTETVGDVVLPVNGDVSDQVDSLLLFDQEKQIQDLDYWISQEMVEMPCSFPGLGFENEMMSFWHLENQIEEEMVDDIAYVELWEGWKS